MTESESGDTMPGRSVDVAEAHAWITRRFAAGSTPAPRLPSEVLVDQLARFPDATVLRLDAQDAMVPLSRYGQSYSMTRSRRAARTALRLLHARGARTLVVEDDLGLRTDPGVSDAAFVGDRLLRWCLLTASGEEAAELLQTGASGYPRNAYVCDADGDVLGLRPGVSLDPDAVVNLASHAVAVLSSVWDDECYVLCCSPAYTWT